MCSVPLYTGPFASGAPVLQKCECAHPRVRHQPWLPHSTPCPCWSRGDPCVQVFLVRHEPTGKAYALKEMEKKKLIMCKQHNNVLSERRVLQQVCYAAQGHT